MSSDQMKAEDRIMHTQDNEAQFAPTVTSETTGVEKKNKDTSSRGTESLRIRRDSDMFIQRCWWEGLCGSETALKLMRRF